MYADIIGSTLAESRPFQERICTKAHGLYIDTGIRSCLIESPTGSGKTIMGHLIARGVQEELNCGIGWVAMRRNLLTQAHNANIDMRLGATDVEYISMFDKNPPTHDRNGRPIRLLVVDEAQHDAANSMGFLHNTIKPDHVLGLTATPFRTDRVKLCFDKVIRDAGIHALIEQGYLSQYHAYVIEKWTVDIVLETFLREPDRWGKSVMFWHKREDADECTARLKSAGIRTELVVADNDPKCHRRNQQLEDFDAGKIDVLVNMFILTEGFDSPSLKTVFVRDSQKGPTVQMAGRVFRKYRDVDFKQVVQSKMTHWPIHRTAAPAESFLRMDDSWRSYKMSENIERVSSSAMLAMVKIDTKMPSFIEQHKGRRRRFGGSQMGMDGTGPRDESGGAYIH
jgi:superfamily II DNA or RNA helicase